MSGAIASFGVFVDGVGVTARVTAQDLQTSEAEGVVIFEAPVEDRCFAASGCYTKFAPCFGRLEQVLGTKPSRWRRAWLLRFNFGIEQGFFSPNTPVDHLTPMGVAAAYMAEMLTDDVKVMTSAAETGLVGSAVPFSKIVVVAPQEGQVGDGR